MEFTSGWGIVAYCATLMIVYYIGKSRGKESVQEVEEEPQKPPIIDMEKERQLWRLEAKEKELAHELKVLRNQKKSYNN